MRKSKIVIAEDDPSLSRIMEYSLKGEGFEVNVFPNGKEALSFLKEKDVDLIISDLSMPEMGGMELLKEIQKMKIDVLFLHLFPDFRYLLRSLFSGEFNRMIPGLRM